MAKDDKQDEERGGVEQGRRDFLKGSAAAAGAGLAAAAVPGVSVGDSAESEPQNPYGPRPGSGISLPEYFRPWPAIKNRNMYLPGTETCPRTRCGFHLCEQVITLHGGFAAGVNRGAYGFAQSSCSSCRNSAAMVLRCQRHFLPWDWIRASPNRGPECRGTGARCAGSYKCLSPVLIGHRLPVRAEVFSLG